MAVIHGNESEFETLIGNGVVLVDFFATWCGPCKMLGPVLEEMSEERDSLKIVKIDIDENMDLARKYGIMSVPTLILFKDGKQISTKNGFMPKELLTKWIEEHR